METLLGFMPFPCLNQIKVGRIEGMKKPRVLVLDEAIPKSTNDFSLSSISHPKVVKQMDEFLVKEKRNRFEAQSQAHDS